MNSNLLQNFLFKLFLVSICPFLGISPALFGQERQHYFNSIGIDDGLSQSVVDKIAQDSFGFMWFGTFDGLNRFDGSKIKIFKSKQADSTSLSGNVIQDILVDSTGNLWVANSKGLDLYQANEENFKRIKLNLDFNKVNIKKLRLGEKQILWILSQSSVIKINTSNFTLSSVYNTQFKNLNDFIILNDSLLLLSTINKLILLNTQTTNFKVLKTFNSTINSIEQCNNHIVVSSSNGAFCLNKIDFKIIKHFTSSNGLVPKNYIHHAVPTKGKIYFATIKGIAVYDTLTQKSEFIFTNNSNKHQLLSNQTRRIYIDRTDNIWIGQIGGISWFTPKFEVFKHIIPGYTNTSKSENKDLKIIWSILKSSDNHFWIATMRQGLFKSQDSSFSHFKPIALFDKRKIENSAVYALAEDSVGQIWIGADDGVYLKKVKKKNPQKIINSDRIGITTQIFVDSINNIWLGTANGLLFYNPKTDSLINILNQNNKKIGLISKLFFDNNSLIISGQSGIYTLNLIDFYQNRTNTRLANYISSKNFEYSSIVDIYKDSQKRIWFVGQNGLFQFEKKENKFKEFAELNIEQQFFYSILEDTTGILWISSGYGIYSFNPKNGRLSHYNEENGMKNLEFNSNSKYIDKKGNIYFGGLNGIISFNPYNIPKNNLTPKVFIHKFKLYNNEITLKDKSKILTKSILLTKNIQLKYFQNFFSLEFSSPEYYQHNKLIYAYKLSGLEKNWHFTKAKENYAQYTNVPPGNYTLILKAQNSEGYWTDPPQEIKIQISPPFWKTIWFTLFIILAIVSGIITLIIYRERQLKYEKKVLEIKVKERTLQIEKARKELETEKLFSESIIQNAIDGIIVLDEENNYSVINQALSDILGYSKQEIYQISYFKLIPTKWQQTERELFEKAKLGERIFAEKEFYHSSGRIIPVEVSTNSIILNNKTYIVAIIRDISKRKILEKQLQEYNQRLEILVTERTKELLIAKENAENADKLKTEFLSNLSHEVRTPMNAINGFAQLLGMEHTNIDQKRRFVDLILDNSQKLLRLIEDIVDLSKFETQQIKAEYTEIDLFKFLKEIHSEYESYLNLAFKNLSIKLENINEKIIIRSDIKRLKQILLHLIENAVKYTEEGLIKIGYELVGNKIMLYIEDQGVGIPAENLKKIFNVFEKPDFNKNKIYRGLGIGLALVKANAELLSCSLVVQSEVGKGTRVELYHPAEDIKKRTIEKQKVSKISFEGKKFLVAEDEEMNYEVIANLLKSKKAEINWASNGKIAIDKFKTGNYDAILMDIKMPIMDGIQATKMIKRINPNIPLIIITAFNESEQIKNAYKAGANFVVSKPFKIDFLLQTINESIQNAMN